jgi:hypothetical protein
MIDNIRPTDRHVTVGDKRIGRYCYQAHHKTLMWFHSGLHKFDEPAWAMEMCVEQQIDNGVKHIFIPHEQRVYHIDRSALVTSLGEVDGNSQYVVKASDDAVSDVGSVSDLSPALQY